MAAAESSTCLLAIPCRVFAKRAADVQRKMATKCQLAAQIEQRLLARNQILDSFFAARSASPGRGMPRNVRPLSARRPFTCLRQGPYATDAQHVSVEFVHPVIVGKRALPALDLSILFGPWLEAIVRPDDIVMGFGPPEGDPAVWVALDAADSRGAMTFALPGLEGSYTIPPSNADPFIHQELVEILYHTLWETVHVFFEHRELGHDVGEAGFLYPFLGREKQLTADTTAQVADSIRMKVADDARLRAQVAQEEAEQIGNATSAIAERVRRGGKLIIFGNGGSATDANDWAIDCVSPPVGLEAYSRCFAFARTREHHRNRQ